MSWSEATRDEIGIPSSLGMLPRRPFGKLEGIRMSLVLLRLMLYRLVQHDLGRHSMYLPTLASYLDEIRVALVSEGKRKPRFIVEEMDKKAANLFAKVEMSKFVPD